MTVKYDFINFVLVRSLDSAVGIETGLRTGWPSNRGPIPSRAKRFFLFAFSSAVGLTQPSVQWVLWAKCLGREADHWPPCSAQVKNQCGIIYLHTLCLHDVHRNNTTFICFALQYYLFSAFTDCGVFSLWIYSECYSYNVTSWYTKVSWIRVGYFARPLTVQTKEKVCVPRRIRTCVPVLHAI